MIVDAAFGAALDPAARDWLDRRAVDLTENGFPVGASTIWPAGVFPAG